MVYGFIAKSHEIFDCLDETEIESLNEGRQKWLHTILSMGEVSLLSGSSAQTKLIQILTSGNCIKSLAALNTLLEKKSGMPTIS